MEPSDGLRIISLDITNVRKIKAFKMVLDGKNLHIAGDVSEGKTTAVNAMWEILTKSQDSIAHGERKGIIKIKLGAGERTIFAERVTSKTKSGINSTVRIFNENGDKVSARDFNQMISSLAVNPHKIKDMPPGEQVQALLKSAKVDGDIPQLERDIFAKEQERLDAYRDMNNAKPTGERPNKAERVNVNELLTQLDEAEVVNKDNQHKRSLLDDRQSDKVSIEEEIKTIQAKLAELKTEQKDIDERIAKGKAIVADLKDADTGSIRASLASATETNDNAIAYESYVQAVENHLKLDNKHHACDDAVKKLKDQKTQALEGAQWPIDGLAIVEGQIYYNDCLLENLGESEQMLVCAALAMNDILAHDIRVVRMDGIESMSETHMQKLVEIFNGHGIQVLSTRVSRGDTVEGEIEIVDGEYKEGE